MARVSEASIKLRELRERAGLTRGELAALVNRSATTYGHYETRYKRPLLPVELAREVAQALAERGIDPAEVQALAGGEAGASAG